VVDEPALVAALESGVIAGAALDVYETEPLPAESPLRAAPNLVMTPHLGASTDEAQVRVAVEVAEALVRALVDGDLSGSVNGL
jgi:D-3-phosphoglycerate dehydrogenase